MANKAVAYFALSGGALRALVFAAALALVALACLSGCAGTQAAVRADSAQANPIEGQASTLIDISDPAEKAAVLAAKEKVRALGAAPRVVATSPAVVEICDKLEIDLVGVPQSSLYDVPSRYAGVREVGTAMSPDMEVVGSLAPDWVLSPASLQPDLEPKYEALGCDWAFLNLNSVQGMYRSILELGEIFDRRSQAEALADGFASFYSAFQSEHAGTARPKVLVLMGLPGSYVIATEKSYVGNLVELAGGENVFAGGSEQFLTVNTEDMKGREPDVILRAAHALPDQVKGMFDDEFKTNDIWKHFDAVAAGRVYDLPYDTFGMSATFDYAEALGQLDELLYGKGE